MLPLLRESSPVAFETGIPLLANPAPENAEGPLLRALREA